MPTTIKRVKNINFSSKEEDVEIINKIKNGDKNAFEGIVKKYRVHIFNKVTKSVGFDHEYTEDIVQDVLMKVYTNIDKYDPTHYSFSAWITTVTKNQLIDQIRKDKVTPTYRNSLRIASNPEISADGGNDRLLNNQISEEHLSSPTEMGIDHQMDRNQRVASIRNFINSKLSHSEKEIVTMFYLDQLKYQEIIDKLGIDMSSVKINLYRARNKFKQEFGHSYAH